VGFFMRLQGDSKTGAGHAGLMDMLNDIFAPGKEHSKEQQQYDERVGRRETKVSGKPLDFGSNQIAIVVPDPAKAAAETATVDMAAASAPEPAPEAKTDASPSQAQPAVKKIRSHRNRS
jgi:hypothetical protein